MKTAEELNALKNEAEALNKKLGELTKDELKQVTGGDYTWHYWYCPNPECPYYNERHIGRIKSDYCKTCGTKLKIVI